MRHPKETAFSLPEIAVALTILGILAVLVTPRAASFLVQARRGEAKVNLEHIKHLQAIYRVEHGSANSSAWKVGYTGAGTSKCAGTAAELLNPLGFSPKGCSSLRYSYYVRSGHYYAFGPSDYGGKWIYPDCSGGTASECTSNPHTYGDLIKTSDSMPIEVCRNIVKYCPTSTGGVTPTYTCTGYTCSDSSKRLKSNPPSITVAPDDGLCCEPKPTCPDGSLEPPGGCPCNTQVGTTPQTKQSVCESSSNKGVWHGASTDLNECCTYSCSGFSCSTGHLKTPSPAITSTPTDALCCNAPTCGTNENTSSTNAQENRTACSTAGGTWYGSSTDLTACCKCETLPRTEFSSNRCVCPAIKPAGYTCPSSEPSEPVWDSTDNLGNCCSPATCDSLKSSNRCDAGTDYQGPPTNTTPAESGTFKTTCCCPTANPKWLDSSGTKVCCKDDDSNGYCDIPPKTCNSYATGKGWNTSQKNTQCVPKAFDTSAGSNIVSPENNTRWKAVCCKVVPLKCSEFIASTTIPPDTLCRGNDGNDVYDTTKANRIIPSGGTFAATCCKTGPSTPTTCQEYKDNNEATCVGNRTEKDPLPIDTGITSAVLFNSTCCEEGEEPEPETETCGRYVSDEQEKTAEDLTAGDICGVGYRYKEDDTDATPQILTDDIELSPFTEAQFKDTCCEAQPSSTTTCSEARTSKASEVSQCLNLRRGAWKASGNYQSGSVYGGCCGCPDGTTLTKGAGDQDRDDCTCANGSPKRCPQANPSKRWFTSIEEKPTPRKCCKTPCPTEAKRGNRDKKSIIEWYGSSDEECYCPANTPKWDSNTCKTTCKLYNNNGETDTLCGQYGATVPGMNGAKKTKYGGAGGTNIDDVLISNTTTDFGSNCCALPSSNYACSIETLDDKGISCPTSNSIQSAIKYTKTYPSMGNITIDNCCCPDNYDNWDHTISPSGKCKTQCMYVKHYINSSWECPSGKVYDSAKAGARFTEGSITRPEFNSRCCTKTCTTANNFPNTDCDTFYVWNSENAGKPGSTTNFNADCCRPAKCDEWQDKGGVCDINSDKKILKANLGSIIIRNSFKDDCCKAQGTFACTVPNPDTHCLAKNNVHRHTDQTSIGGALPCPCQCVANTSILRLDTEDSDDPLVCCPRGTIRSSTPSSTGTCCKPDPRNPSSCHACYDQTTNAQQRECEQSRNVDPNSWDGPWG